MNGALPGTGPTGYLTHGLELPELGEVTVFVREGPEQSCAFVLGELAEGCLVRVHSRCVYGDVFGAADCDCGSQLAVSLARIAHEGVGAVIYLDQEGRGCGLAAKAMAHRLAEQEGVDTFTAFARMGLPSDPRDYSWVSRFLLDRGLTAIRLLSNNPRKIDALKDAGIAVERIPLVMSAHPRSAAYLAAKRGDGHLL
ncbi:GTP cyclohydrolase II [Cellulomonas sp. Y8]|uniref:GTP cyclohydrolase II n=1 Tax=Cellulomonas sp. Y8 TaxID=2591145 RepID=UPI0011C8035B|nr:GTP cyclohydrolase II [Cellulomonas sp. Y8]